MPPQLTQRYDRDMNEHRAFRFALLLAGLWIAVAVGLWGSDFVEARRLEAESERLVSFQSKMKSACNEKPEFAGCVPADEFISKRLELDFGAFLSRQAAAKKLPWIAAGPLAILLAFYAVRWGVTGRLRPWWPVKEGHPR